MCRELSGNVGTACGVGPPQAAPTVGNCRQLSGNVKGIVWKCRYCLLGGTSIPRNMTGEGERSKIKIFLFFTYAIVSELAMVAKI